MFSLLISPKGLTKVISQNSNDYWLLKIVGYEETATGTKDEMNRAEEEYVSENYGRLAE